MTEQQRYQIVRRYDEFEMRRYPLHLVAEINIGGSFEDAAKRAFRFLFAYISGDNQASQEISMTAPVVQEPVSERIVMTATDVPVQQSGQAASTQSTARQVGSALGIAICRRQPKIEPQSPIENEAT